MKYRMLRTMWRCEESGFRCELNLGEKEGKHDEAFIPVHQDTPMGPPLYIVWSSGRTRVEYVGPDGERARRIGGTGKIEQIFLASEDQSEVVRAGDDKGTILIRRGRDKTDRVLLFVGCHSPIRGRVAVFDEETNGKIVATCVASNEREGTVEVAVILEVGQTIAFRQWGGTHGEDRVLIYYWDGNDAYLKERVSHEVWQTRQDVDDLAAAEVERL